MIGLNIRVKNATDKYLFKIFARIDLSEYSWEISDNYIINPKLKVSEQGFFCGNVLSGDVFSKCISVDQYYMVYADIKAYPSGSEHTEIVTYKDYLASECRLVLLCTDVTFIDIYCKDEHILKKIHQNCLASSFEKVSLFTETDDSRTRMSIW